MEIEPLQANEIHLLGELIPPGWETAIPAIDFYTKSCFCFPIKASIDNRIAGIGTTIIQHETAWLAHIIVHPEFRNQGLGKIITENLIERAHLHGCETMYLLATELGEPVYKKLGFNTETEYVFYKGDKLNEPLIHSQNIVPFKSDFIEEISHLDRKASGEDRMFQFEQHLNGGIVYFQNNEVKGFYLPGLGDGLIIANSNEAGVELMKVRLLTKDFAVFPSDNIVAAEFMKLHNFKQDRTQKRMRLGKYRDWMPINIYNRIGGNLG